MRTKEYYVLVIDEGFPSIEDRDEVLEAMADNIYRLENKLDRLAEILMKDDKYRLNCNFNSDF